MLRGLTAKQFREWEFYAALEPFDEMRSDYRAAIIATIIANVNRGKNQKAFKLTDFMLKFDEEVAAPKRQTWKDQLAIAHLIAQGYSAKAKDM